MPETTSPPKSAVKPASAAQASSASAKSSASAASAPPRSVAAKSPGSAAAKPSRPVAPKHRGWGWLKGLFWLLVISGLAAGGYWVGMQALAREAELVGQLREQRRQVDEQRGQLQALLGAQAEREARLQEQLAQAQALTVQQLEAFTAQIDGLREAQRPGDHRLRLMAVEWLVLSAHTQNTLRLDPALAVAALEIADQQLRALPPVQVAGLRRTLAHVQAELATAAAFDLTGVGVDLQVLGERVNSLTLPVRRLPAPTQGTPPSADADEPFWRQMWRDLRAMIVIEKRTAEVDILLLPELGQVLRQRIGLALDFAHEALLRRDEARYRAHLEALDTLVGRHFESSPETEAWRNQVRALKERRISLPAVSFDTLLAELRELRAQQSR